MPRKKRPASGTVGYAHPSRGDPPADRGRATSRGPISAQGRAEEEGRGAQAIKELPPLPFTPTNSPGKDSDAPQRGRPQRRRRLSDYMLIAFHVACDWGDLQVAEQLITILERMLQRPPPEGLPERRVDAQPFVAAHERLWSLRHPEARDS